MKKVLRDLAAIPIVLPLFLCCLCAAVLLALFLWIDDKFLGVL